MVSFSQEEFEQQLNLHLRKYRRTPSNLHKSITRLESLSVSPIHKSMPAPIPRCASSFILNPKDSSSSVILGDHDQSYADELKDEIHDIET